MEKLETWSERLCDLKWTGRVTMSTWHIYEHTCCQSVDTLSLWEYFWAFRSTEGIQYTKIGLVLETTNYRCISYFYDVHNLCFSSLILNNYNLLWQEKYFSLVSHEDVLPQHIQGISRKCQWDTSQTGDFITCGFCSQHCRITVKGSIPMLTWQIMLNYI